MTGRERLGDEPHAPQGTSQSVYWANLYEQCHRQVRAYFARHVRCPHDVEDLVQDVFANLIARGGRLQEPTVYVRAVARHQLRAYWRRKGRRNLVVERVEWLCRDSLLAEGTYCDWASNPLTQLGNKEVRETVTLMVNSLSPASAEILRLRYIKEMDPEEAASQTGCSRETVKKRLTRAKQSLARLCAGRPGGRTIRSQSLLSHIPHLALMA